MYVPTAFQQHDRVMLFDFMRRHSFATLVSQHEGLPFATHLPLLVDAAAGEHGSCRDTWPGRIRSRRELAAAGGARYFSAGRTPTFRPRGTPRT